MSRPRAARALLVDGQRKQKTPALSTRWCPTLTSTVCLGRRKKHREEPFFRTTSSVDNRLRWHYSFRCKALLWGASHYRAVRGQQQIKPAESPCATVKARTTLTKGAGSRKAGLAMAFSLWLAPEKHWPRVNAPHLVPLVGAGLKFPNGQAKVLRLETSHACLLTHIQSECAATQTSIHEI